MEVQNVAAAPNRGQGGVKLGEPPVAGRAEQPGLRVLPSKLLAIRIALPRVGALEPELGRSRPEASCTRKAGDVDGHAPCCSLIHLAWPAQSSAPLPSKGGCQKLATQLVKGERAHTEKVEWQESPKKARAGSFQLACPYTRRPRWPLAVQH